MVFVLPRAWDKEEIPSSHEESDSALRCSTTEPQRLHSEWGLLRNSIQKYYAIDIANPRSTQDACHMNFVRDFTYRESLWLSGRASESGIRRSEVRFVIGTQKFSLFHARDKTKIIFISLPSSSTQDRGHSFSQYGPTTKVGMYSAVHESVTVSRGQR